MHTNIYTLSIHHHHLLHTIQVNMSSSFLRSWLAPADTWTLSLRRLEGASGAAIAVSTSSGGLTLLSAELSPVGSISAHEASISGITKVDELTLASSSSDGVKVWDLRQASSKPQFSLSSARKSNFLSIASSGTTLAAGTELAGQDAELYVWDLRNTQSPLRLFADSHHDDISSVNFHQSLPYVVSGCTDGNVLVQKLDEPDEDEALHQVIPFASVHSCSFLKPNRIYVLSHMETLAFFELNSTDYETHEEPPAHELGDVRAIWPDCEYVVDIYQDYAAFGANLRNSLSIVPFDAATEKFDLGRRVAFPDAHGSEVVRDVLLWGETVYSAGEDGLVKAWRMPENTEDKETKNRDKKRKEQEKHRRKQGLRSKNGEKREKLDRKANRFKPY